MSPSRPNFVICLSLLTCLIFRPRAGPIPFRGRWEDCPEFERDFYLFFSLRVSSPTKDGIFFPRRPAGFFFFLFRDLNFRFSCRYFLSTRQGSLSCLPQSPVPFSFFLLFLCAERCVFTLSPPKVAMVATTSLLDAWHSYDGLFVPSSQGTPTTPPCKLSSDPALRLFEIIGLLPVSVFVPFAASLSSPYHSRLSFSSAGAL